MSPGATQTLWAELVAATLADAGVTTCVISPGSRSTPLVAALAAEPRLELATIIDERAAAFFALGAARATGRPAAIVCTSGTAAAHYLPAIVEASLAGVPLLAITADRPPELHGCGASQTIDQVKLYGDFVRGALDLGAPTASALALRAVRRKVVQAVALARGPHPGPVHLEVPLRKPLEPTPPSTDDERALAGLVATLRGPVTVDGTHPARAAHVATPPTLVADPGAIAALAEAIAREPHGIIVAGAMPATFGAAADRLLAFAARIGYPVLAEAGSQLRFGPGGPAAMIDRADLIPVEQRPTPRLVIQLGAEPVAASWPVWLARLVDTERWVLADHRWQDPDSSARGVIIGDVAATLIALDQRVGLALDQRVGIALDQRVGLALDQRVGLALDQRVGEAGMPPPAAAARWCAGWAELDARAGVALDAALGAHPDSEAAMLRAALGATPAAVTLQIGNSLPIRVIDQVAARGDLRRTVLTQRGAAGIDGLVASAAGATRAGAPVLLVLGDVSFAHDLGGLLAARWAAAPLAILVVDNRGGQIFAGLPIGRATGLAEVLEHHFLTAPELDPAAVAVALGARAITAATPASVATAIATALASPGTTVIHAPVTASGARAVRHMTLELQLPAPPRGGTHD